MLTTQFAFVAVALALIWLATARRVEPGHFLAIAIFAVYLVGVANFVILPLRYDPSLADAVGPIDLGRLIGLKPFFLPGGDRMSSEQLFYNVLLTVPFGFGLPFVRRMPLWSVVVAGIAFSAGIELTQLVADATHLALPTWSVDINDVLLNSTGVIIGVIAFGATSALYRALVGSRRLNLGPLTHFHETLLRQQKAGSEQVTLTA